MKKILLFLSIFCFFFACKKEEKSTPIIDGKELEIGGIVIDFETQKPLEGVNIIRTRFFDRYDFTPKDDIEVKEAVTGADGKYKFKFIAKDKVTYWIGLDKKDYLEFDGTYSCDGCVRNITPLYSTINGSNINDNINTIANNHLSDTFYMSKAGNLNVNYKLGATPLNDTLFVKNHQFYNGKKIGHDYPFSSNYKDNTISTRNIKALADRMTYLSWKLKSETKWHQDSVFTPYGQTVNFEIKY